MKLNSAARRKGQSLPFPEIQTVEERTHQGRLRMVEEAKALVLPALPPRTDPTFKECWSHWRRLLDRYMHLRKKALLVGVELPQYPPGWVKIKRGPVGADGGLRRGTPTKPDGDVDHWPTRRPLPALTDSERCSNVEVVWRHAVRVLEGEHQEAAERVADAWGIAALHHQGGHTVQGLMMEGRAKQLAVLFERLRDDRPEPIYDDLDDDDLNDLAAAVQGDDAGDPILD